MPERFSMVLPDGSLERWRGLARQAGFVSVSGEPNVSAWLRHLADSQQAWRDVGRQPLPELTAHADPLPPPGVVGGTFPRGPMAREAVPSSDAVAAAMVEVEQAERAADELDAAEGRRTIHREFPDGSVVTTVTTASEAAAAAAKLPDPAPPARGRVPTAETVCIHGVQAPAWCRKCQRRVGT